LFNKKQSTVTETVIANESWNLFEAGTVSSSGSYSLSSVAYNDNNNLSSTLQQRGSATFSSNNMAANNGVVQSNGTAVNPGNTARGLDLDTFSIGRQQRQLLRHQQRLDHQSRSPTQRRLSRYPELAILYRQLLGRVDV
jgi:hypothetical protein